VKPWQPNELRQLVDELVAEKAGSIENATRKLEREYAELSAQQQEQTIVDAATPMRTRQRLRPELVRALSEAERVGLVLLGLEQPEPAAAAEVLRTLSAEVTLPDLVVPVSNEKVAVLLMQQRDGVTVDEKIEALRARIGELQKGGALPAAAVVATVMPDAASDPDEALMRASTALVLAKKQLRANP
jgi:hypothetical protein